MAKDTLTQISLRLPAEVLAAAEDIARTRAMEAKKVGRWSAARVDRSAVLREALELGLAEIAGPNDGKKARR